MRPIQKVLMTVLWGLTVLIMVSVIGAGLWRKRRSEWPLDHPVPAFSLVDQDNKPVTTQSLLGKPWIADFVFTHCAGPCPRMTHLLADLQKDLPPNVQLVSFSVDPERDSPAVLKEYAAKMQADETRWRFLTGPKETIFATATGMLISAAPADDQNAIRHSTRFVLVDADGKIRSTYDTTDDKALAQLKRDAVELAEKR